MNVLEYINSRDIKEHLKQIKYKFSPLESAYLIWQSKNHSVEDKHFAWETLIQTTQDEKVDKELYYVDTSSLHNFLKKYMEIEKSLIDEFYRQDDNSIYVYKTCWINHEFSTECDDVFKDFDICFKEATYDTEDVEKIIFTKKSFCNKAGGHSKMIKLTFSPDKKLLEVYHIAFLEEKEFEINRAFEEMWFDIPTPFEKGDIVYVPNGLVRGCPPTKYPFVLTNICYWGLDEEKLNNRRKRFSDMDMTANGYFQNEYGQLYGECMHDYLDIEYYTEELKGTEKILKALSNYFKGKIDVSLLMNSYSIILKENETKEHRKYLGFTDEYLNMAGLL